ncbi:MAG: rane protein [Rhizobacter sp.]|nr:rane protein [Rhizobacter sp.]
MTRGIAKGRYDRLDALRAVAMLWMAAFHFAFDLNYFGFLEQNFYSDSKWTLQRTCIVSLFLICAGFGQAIAFEQGQSWPRFWRRWMQVAGAAVLVTAGSYFVFPHSFIYFGVLHGIAAMLLLTRLLAWLSRRTWERVSMRLSTRSGPARGRGQWLLAALGLVAVLAPLIVQSPFFDSPHMNWVGLVTHKPITEDYVPLLPWLGMTWWGMALGGWVLARHAEWVTGDLPAALRPLAVLGRWSLAFYLLHQPVMFGLLAGVRALLKIFSAS